MDTASKENARTDTVKIHSELYSRRKKFTVGLVRVALKPEYALKENKIRKHTHMR
jgi:hypothetical protein